MKLTKQAKSRFKKNYGFADLDEYTIEAIKILLEDKKRAFGLVQSCAGFKYNYEKHKAAMLSKGDHSRMQDSRDRKQYGLESLTESDRVTLYLIKHDKTNALIYIRSEIEPY